MIDQKYACLINFPNRRAFNRVMSYTVCKLGPSLYFTTFQFMTSSFYVLHRPVIDQKYACLINFPNRHAFNDVMSYTVCKLEPSLYFTTFKFMTSSFYVLDDVI